MVSSPELASTWNSWEAAADIAGVRLNSPKLQLHSGEDALIASVHFIVGDVKAGLIQVKRIGIFHREFPGPHHTETRPAFIAKLGLNLVKVYRQLFVAVNLASEQIGYHLFMGRAETKIPIVAVLHAQHFIAHLLPSPGLHPKLGGLHNGHRDFLPAAAIHLLPYDALDFRRTFKPSGSHVYRPLAS